MRKSPRLMGCLVAFVAVVARGAPNARADEPPPPLPTPPTPSASPPPVGPPAFAPPPPTAVVPPNAVAVRLVADDRRAGLWQVDPQKTVLVRSEPADVYALVCVAPCAAHVDRAARLRVMGSGLVPSRELALPTGAHAAEVRASTGSAAVRSAAFATLGLGALAGVFSGLMLVGEASERDTARAIGADDPAARDRLESRANAWRNVGVGGLVATGVFVLGSIALLAASRTTVDVEPR